MAKPGLKFAYFLMATAAVFAGGAARPASAQSNEPIKIGVIAEVQSIAGAATPGGAQIAADEINAKGGVNGRKIEIVSYDNKSSSADSVRAFQRAVSDDKVSAVIASYISEVVLALEPWAARLHMPLITRAPPATRSPSRFTTTTTRTNTPSTAT
jgi:branched-chain amino acid transport system substrate-binding protein